MFPFGNLYELADAFVKIGGTHLFIDEIHKYNNWSQELKNIYDDFSGLKVVFSGSSILEIQKGKADLSRRAVVYSMQGLSFREYLQIETGKDLKKYSLNDLLHNPLEICSVINSDLKPLGWFSEYIKYGYYPYYLQGKDTYHLKLAETINLVLETELPYLFPIQPGFVDKLRRLVYILASQVPFKLNVSGLAAVLEISRPTLLNYIYYLDKAKIVRCLPPMGKGNNSLAKPGKVYLHHPNLFYALAGENTDTGTIRESFILNQLSFKHLVTEANNADFLVDDKITIEAGGKNKGFSQITGLSEGYVAADDIEYPFEKKLPLWLFGFLY